MTTGVRPDIAAMNGYVPGEQLAPGKFIKLNTNENPYAPSDQALRAIRESVADRLTRYPDPHATAFRLVAADVLGVGPDWILCGNGSDDILTIVTRAFAAAGQRVRIPSPSYVLYRTLAEIQGAEVDEVPFESDWTLSPGFTEPDSRVRLAFLPNPNSPSGTCLDPETIERAVQRMDCPLLIDEAYADFAEQDCLELVARDSRVMVARTLSKAYALAGLRFGFLVAQPAIVAELSKVKDSYNCDTLSIAGATGALGDQAWLRENRSHILRSRSRLEKGMKELGFQVQPSQANFVWCTWPDRPLQPIYEKLKAAHVLVRYMDYPHWGEGLRISVGTDDQIDACVTLLKAILNDDT